MNTFTSLAKNRTTQRSSTAGSVGKKIPCFTMLTSNLTTQLTFLNVVSNTSMKQYSLLINVRMVIWVTTNTSPNLPCSRYILLSSYKNTGAVQKLQNNWIHAYVGREFQTGKRRFWDKTIAVNSCSERNKAKKGNNAVFCPL
jgi:hypothetical protein